MKHYLNIVFIGTALSALSTYCAEQDTFQLSSTAAVIIYNKTASTITAKEVETERTVEKKIDNDWYKDSKHGKVQDQTDGTIVNNNDALIKDDTTRRLITSIKKAVKNFDDSFKIKIDYSSWTRVATATVLGCTVKKNFKTKEETCLLPELLLNSGDTTNDSANIVSAQGAVLIARTCLEQLSEDELRKQYSICSIQ